MKRDNISIIKKKLRSMRYSKKDVQSETSRDAKQFMYGYTECINDLLEYLTSGKDGLPEHELLADEPAGQGGEKIKIPDNMESESALCKYAKKMKEDFTKPSGIAMGWRACYEWILLNPSESKQDKEQEIIKALSGEEIEDVPTFTSTEYPIEQQPDKEEMELLDLISMSCEHLVDIPIKCKKRLVKELKQYHKSQVRGVIENWLNYFYDGDIDDFTKRHLDKYLKSE